MQNPIEACLIIPMMFLVPMIESSSIACLRDGDEPCSGHTLICKGGKVIWIIDAVYGYRKSCGQQLAPVHKNCSSLCCQYLEADCFVKFPESELREVKSNCSAKEKCKITKFIFHIAQNYLECFYVNAYSKIDYECVSRREYYILSSTIWPWVASTKPSPPVQPSTRIQKPIPTSTTIVLSPFPSEPTTKTNSIKVAVTTVKSNKYHQSNKQPSGAVIGGIVSGVILMVVLIMITIFFIKRHRMNRKQAPKRHMPRTVSREIRISAPIALQNTTITTICNSQQTCRNSNSNSEYENVELETTIDPTPSTDDVYYELGTDPPPLVSDVYYQLEAESLQTFYSRLDPETQFELHSPGADVYNHLGEDNSKKSSLDLSDYNHTSDFCEYSDNYHHISADEFKRREANLMDCDYNHIYDTTEENKST
ncbi:hypothetical protein LOTGIDRAFT_154820 [Lottia gigantea]|uniref:Uncharacterized protein n=1 Tax=Lottia gigantea TaxID=225164 RepID=V3Z8T0_LOTGI|nr:hypothetical protein LOTGIDRAFT_154820 [Lottia gigantea]ESO87323.1 hypothetical protein LOTGIDRAFT_154820 [Lottia gigantea]